MLALGWRQAKVGSPQAPQRVQNHAAAPQEQGNQVTFQRSAILITVSALCVGTALGDADGGRAALIARLGASAPTGAGVYAVQVEATMTNGGSDYAPDLSDPEFAGKAVVAVNAPSSNSWHATNVAKWLYGSSTAMATGITNVWVYNVNSWLFDTLNVGAGTTLPAASPNSLVRVMNHSWIGSFGPGNEGYDREAIRRLDYQMTRDGILAVCGENNGAGSARYPMMGDCFNGLSVGRLDLQHSAGDTASASDTPGRMKPDIIAPGQFTSFATPVVGSAAALLFETLRGSAYSSLSNTQRAQIAKACLVGGADRPVDWHNDAPQSGASRGMATKPLDVMRGSGELNVDRAHRIVTATRVNGTSVSTNASPAESMGWGTATLAANGKTYWRFRLNQAAPSFDFTVVWPRSVASSLASYTFANMNLRLQRSLSGGSEFIPLEGDAGVATFESGNVASTSSVDNIETIHLVNLQPGEYTLQVSRADSVSGSVVAYAAWAIDPAGFGPEGDVDASGMVDFGDVALALTSFGTDDPASDIDVNRVVDFGDVALILLNFG